MLNLTHAVRQLKKEREQTQRRLEQLDSALQALTGVGGLSGLDRGTVRSQAMGSAGQCPRLPASGSRPLSVRVGPNGRRLIKRNHEFGFACWSSSNNELTISAHSLSSDMRA